VRTHGTRGDRGSGPQEKTLEAYKALTDAAGTTGKMTQEQFKKFVAVDGLRDGEDADRGGGDIAKHNRQLGTGGYTCWWTR